MGHPKNSLLGGPGGLGSAPGSGPLGPWALGPLPWMEDEGPMGQWALPHGPLGFALWPSCTYNEWWAPKSKGISQEPDPAAELVCLSSKLPAWLWCCLSLLRWMDSTLAFEWPEEQPLCFQSGTWWCEAAAEIQLFCDPREAEGRA